MAGKIRIGTEARRLLLELLVVTFGVYLGLLGNQWAENRKMKASVQFGLQSIANELAFNKNFITGRMQYYEHIVATLDSLIEVRGADAPIQDIPGFRGINPILARNSSYKLAESTQILANMDYQMADGIALLYSVQDFHLRGADQMLEAYIAGNIDDLSSFRGMFRDFTTMCREMLQFYEQMEPQLPEPKNVMMLN